MISEMSDEQGISNFSLLVPRMIGMKTRGCFKRLVNRIRASGFSFKEASLL